MNSINVTIELPEDETPGELIKGYFTLMRAFGWDLYVTCHFELKGALGPQWFAGRISELKQADPKNWRPNHRFEPQDPGVILRDYVHEGDSPYIGVFGGQWQKQAAARKILGTRNTWFHFGDDPTVGQLNEAAKTVRGFVASSGMHIAPRIDGLIGRLEDMTAGRYDRLAGTALPPTTAVDPEPDAGAGDMIETPSDFPRPSIGGTWVGPIPDLRYRITKAGDLVHPDTMRSVRDRVSGEFSERLRAWTAVEPRGREVWIDADGAIGGYIGASPRLLGYLGDDPDGEVARGFFAPHYYMADGGVVVDLDTNERLATDFADTVEAGTLLRVTTYGDVIVTDDAEGVERVATVTPAQWFSGHLG